MKRRAALSLTASAAAVALFPDAAFARMPLRRRRPGDPNWPSKSAWDRLGRQTNGRLVSLQSPFDVCRAQADSDPCTKLFSNLRNPYYIGDNASLTQTLGWVNAWTSQTSPYAVEAHDAGDVAAAVSFARENDLRLVVKGGGHSYLGTSNAPDSLLVWTRRMNEIVVDGDTVTIEAGAIWVHAYDAVTNQANRYVQGGGCATVGVAGLVQSGGFGSFSKHYGTAASSLVEAEIVTADGRIRTVNATKDPDLHWALKGGGGGTFGVVTKMTLRMHDLPTFFGAAGFSVKASSDRDFARLVSQLVEFYAESLFNDRWGEQIAFGPDNTLDVRMVSYGLDSGAAQTVWKPFLDWLAQRSGQYTFASKPLIVGVPARNWWNERFIREHYPFAIVQNERPDAGLGEFWWSGDSDQVGQVLYAYESVWLPATLLADDNRAHLADSLFKASRSYRFALHFNKGLAGAPRDAIDRAADTATNPAVRSAFALAICAAGEGPAYPGVAGHEPNSAEAGGKAAAVARCMNELRTMTPEAGSYVSESNFFDPHWQRSYWGENYTRLAAVKKKYDPDGLFYVHHGVGSEEWSDDGFTRRG